MAAAITAAPVFPSYAPIRSTSQEAPAQPEAPPADNFQADNGGKDIDEKNFSWADLGRGLASAVASAAVTTVGMTASSLVRAPQALYESEKALFKTDVIGPVLKFTIAPLLLGAAVAAPLLTAVGSAGYGLYKGFVVGAESGPVDAVQQAGQDVKTFHTDLAGKLIDGIQQVSTMELPEGEQPYDIKIGGALTGLAGATVGAAVDGAGIGVITALNVPRALYKVNDAIWSSEASLPLKVGGTLLSIPAAPIAVALGTVGGAVFGMALGAKDGYQEGLGTAASNSFQHVGDYAQMVDKALDELGK